MLMKNGLLMKLELLIRNSRSYRSAYRFLYKPYAGIYFCSGYANNGRMPGKNILYAKCHGEGKIPPWLPATIIVMMFP